MLGHTRLRSRLRIDHGEVTWAEQRRYHLLYAGGIARARDMNPPLLAEGRPSHAKASALFTAGATYRRLSMQRPIPRLFAMTFALVACSDRPTATGPIPTSPSVSAVKFWDDNAAVYWNGVANSLAVKYAKSPFETIRNFGIVSVAGYNADVAAEKAGTGAVHPSTHAAISAASTVALTYLFPGEAAALETRLD